MINSFNLTYLKGRVSWSLVRAHLCTLAVAVGLNSTRRVPAEALRFGGVPYLAALSAAAAAVALPAALLQLAAGQLSQQDAVAIWRAVPFFKGVGFMRLLISFLASLYTIIYIALAATYFLYSISSNAIPFWECMMSIPTPGSNEDSFISQTCPNSTLWTRLVREEPEHFIALSLVIIALWIIFPFLLYNPIKLMKRIFYTLGPLVFLLLAVVAFSIGTRNNLMYIYRNSEWFNFVDSKMWHSAVTQALLSCQLTGGYLISAGDAVYSSTNVQWTALAIVIANVAASWMGTLLWFGLAGARAEVVAPLLPALMLRAAEQGLSTAWPLLVLVSLFFSGIITMLTLLYPLYDRFRRVGGQRWRMISFLSSALGAAASVAVLSGGAPALALLEDTIVPILISIAAILEMVALVYIYGWKALVEDVEFLTGGSLGKCWVVGWCAAPAVLLPAAAWRLCGLLGRAPGWREPPWEVAGVLAAASVATATFIGVATISVVKQVQYDILGKIKSSFKPSRHWGPRDPITHYYWLARREGDRLGAGAGAPGRYARRRLGQLAGGLSFFTRHHTDNGTKTDSPEHFSSDKKRSNSDDWLYTGNRKEYLSETFSNYLKTGKLRSMSLDNSMVHKDGNVSSIFIVKTWTDSCHHDTPPEIVESIKDQARK